MKNKVSVKLMILILSAIVLISGCVPTNYSQSQEDALVQSCMPAIEKFLKERYGEYELGEFRLHKGLIEPEKSLLGNYGSNVVKGTYTVAGNNWDLVYDSETGRFFTSELVELLRKQEEARILKYLKEELPEEDLRDFRLTVLDFSFLVKSHDIIVDNHKNKADTYVYISGVLPAELTAEDLPAFAERGFDGCTITRIGCHYYSDRADALTDDAFKRFFADNPAYQVKQYLLIDNDNPSAKKESDS